ncbi:MAG: biotin--[acetyl-CoA-carboxylase] ligase [Betaproteobacteria bacterium]
MRPAAAQPQDPLQDPPQRWPAEAIWLAAEPLLPGLTVEILPEIDSTNSELMRRCRAGQAEPVLLVAERQSAGRGRLGRSWHSPPGSSLTFSLGLPLAPADWAGLSLAVGVSVAEALVGLGASSVGLKWPNDLWLGQAKLGGILIETAALGEQRYAVVGVGINIQEPAPNWRPPVTGESLAAAPAVAPAWLQAVGPVSAAQLLGTLAPALVRDVLQFERQGWSAFAQRFARLDLLQGRAVLLSDGRQGLACGVSAGGALRLQTAAGLLEVNSGEVSVRPQDLS